MRKVCERSALVWNPRTATVAPCCSVPTLAEVVSADCRTVTGLVALTRPLPSPVKTSVLAAVPPPAALRKASSALMLGKTSISTSSALMKPNTSPAKRTMTNVWLLSALLKKPRTGMLSPGSTVPTTLNSRPGPLRTFVRPLLMIVPLPSPSVTNALAAGATVAAVVGATVGARVGAGAVAVAVGLLLPALPAGKTPTRIKLALMKPSLPSARRIFTHVSVPTTRNSNTGTVSPG